VDDRIHEIRLQAGLIEAQKAAILAALSIADDSLQAEVKLEEVRKEVSQQAKKLAQRIQDAVPQ
jgi:cell division protein ZapA (FtsZ GTPase activity inhibitor)|tara:strand:- start:418 stop:609 length:192 start_codon:yes stop_codon:yes gene_type:complete